MTIHSIVVRTTAIDRRKACLACRDWRWRCALGRTGIGTDKREGDGRTPRGVVRVRALWYRADRIRKPSSPLPTRAIRQWDGWCDDPRHPRYNRPVRLPFAASHERMWRDDGLYDLVLELGWNDRPPVPGRGSAIFMHVARPGLAPTEGCIALPLRQLSRLADRLTRETRIRIA
jgi:L,D-peptidoglycan transpeptidase YkuD (ErfK/YbiS/YcfS/YnhG family)